MIIIATTLIIINYIIIITIEWISEAARWLKAAKRQSGKRNRTSATPKKQESDKAKKTTEGDRRRPKATENYRKLQKTTENCRKRPKTTKTDETARGKGSAARRRR